MLITNLKHIETRQEYETLLTQNDKVMICCGRMGPMCIPVYKVMEIFQEQYPLVAFRDMDFDSDIAATIKSLPECKNFMGLPFTIYYKNGKVVKATTSIQSKEEIKETLDREFV